MQFPTFKRIAVIQDGSFIQQTITKVSTWGRYLGVAFGTYHYAFILARLVLGDFYSTMHINLWWFKVLSVVNYTLFLSNHLQMRWNYFIGKIQCIYLFNLCTNSKIETPVLFCLEQGPYNIRLPVVVLSHNIAHLVLRSLSDVFMKICMYVQSNCIVLIFHSCQTL